jgi:glyoxylase-like metal-dependent hydrolase (beta-lactamase superfamily II)/rhodanese-related sulfurtransferase
VFFRQVLYRDLGCASYLLADGGEAVVVDPRWDIDVYLETARAERLRITHVIDTHDHADHVSGRARLVQATGARGYRSNAGGEPGPGFLTAGDEITVGSVRITAVGAAGHRPEHLCFLVSDRSRADEPWMLLSGDSLLVGDVARPDLGYEALDGARALHASLAELTALPDHVEVWPAHIGGSLCGGAGLSGKSSSTIGFERRANPLLSLDEPDFVDAVVAALPSRPPNVERIVTLNARAEGAPPADPEPLGGVTLLELLRAGVTVLDSRAPDRFDSVHLAGAINLPVSAAGVGTRAGWALDPLAPLVIVAEDEEAARATASALQAVGFWELAGWCRASASAWERAGLAVAQAAAWDLDRLASGLRDGAVELVDVRETPEWRSGHVAGSHHLPLARLRDVDHAAIPDHGRTTAVACAAGVRAAFAASILRRAGRRDVVRVAGGGIADLHARGIDLARGA